MSLKKALFQLLLTCRMVELKLKYAKVCNVKNAYKDLVVKC